MLRRTNSHTFGIHQSFLFSTLMAFLFYLTILKHEIWFWASFWWYRFESSSCGRDWLNWFYFFDVLGNNDLNAATCIFRLLEELTFVGLRFRFRGFLYEEAWLSLEFLFLVGSLMEVFTTQINILINLIFVSFISEVFEFLHSFSVKLFKLWDHLIVVLSHEKLSS